MSSSPTARHPAPAARRIRIRRLRVTAVLVVVAAIAILADQALTSSSPTGSSSSAVPRIELPRPEHRERRAEHAGPLGVAGGAVPDGVSVFDDAIPGVARLDPALLDAVRRAATDAAADGVDVVVESGWRSPAYQEQLLREAVAEHGSEAEAARWVATPTTSAHVAGDAVDLGPSDAAAWLSEHGAAYGLCQIYANEPWHFELRPEAPEQGCPAMYADPTEDPRMRR